MYNKDPNSQNQAVGSAQPRLALSANSLDITKPPKTTKKAVLYSAVVIIILGILLGVVVVKQNTDADKKNANTPVKAAASSTRTQSQDIQPQSDAGDTLNTTQNPLDTNNQIKAEANYCSNAINAQLLC